MKKLPIYLVVLSFFFFFLKDSFAQNDISSYTCTFSTSFKAQDTVHLYQQETILATLFIDWKQATIATPEGSYFLSHRAKRLFQNSTDQVSLGHFKRKKITLGTQSYTEKRIKRVDAMRGWDYYDGDELVLKLRYVNQDETYQLQLDVLKEDANTWKLLSFVSNRFIHRVPLDYEDEDWFSFATMIGAVIGALASF